MFTIKMDTYKNLIVTTPEIRLLQRESLADKIQFYCPMVYENHQLSEFKLILSYTNPGNVPKCVLLQQSGDCMGYLRYILPVDTGITAIAGKVKMHLTFTKVDLSISTQYIIKSLETEITITALPDYFAFIPDESLEALDQMVGLFDAKIQAANKIAEAYSEKKADNIQVENGELSLLANGNKIGSSIPISEIETSEADALKTVYF